MTARSMLSAFRYSALNAEIYVGLMISIRLGAVVNFVAAQTYHVS